MVNLEHILTVDDLIVEYMIYKVKNGYEPQFLTSEFISFLHFFESKMSVQDSLYENEKLFQRFFERKARGDWYETINWKTNEKQVTPHMDMIYSEKDDDYIIKANYGLNGVDISMLNTYFMDNGRSRFDNFQGTAARIRKIIGEYLSDQPKREIDGTIEIDDTALIIGKSLAAEIIRNIWNSHISKQIEYHKWPEQCKDIDKYLFEMDLAEIIGVKSIKSELVELYNVFSKRIAILYKQDRNLKITSFHGSYLARANYELLIQGYENIINTTFGPYKKSLDIDLASSTFKESHEISQIKNDNVTKLVRTLDKNIQNN